ATCRCGDRPMKLEFRVRTRPDRVQRRAERGGYNARPPPNAPGKGPCMWYAIEGHDGDNVLAQRREARAGHLARLEVLRDAGRLLLAGPCPAIDAVDPGPAGFSGSI